MRKPVFQQRLYSKQKSNHVCHFLYIWRSNGGQGPRLLAILHQYFLSVDQHFRFLLHKYHFEHIASHLAARNKNLLTYCALHTNIHCFKNSKMKPEVLIHTYIHTEIYTYICISLGQSCFPKMHICCASGPSLLLYIQNSTIMLRWTSDPGTLDPNPRDFLGLLQMAIFC